MTMSDPISDMLTRIRNGQKARKVSVSMPASKAKEAVAKVLKDEGYIEDYKRIEDNKQGLIRVYLKYGRLGEDVVIELKRVSRPGRRSYSSVEDLPRPLDGLGVAIISTSSGVLSDRKCREQNVGGEVLCTVC